MEWTAISLYALWGLFLLVTCLCVVFVFMARFRRGQFPKPHEMPRVFAFLNKVPRWMNLLWWALLFVSILVSLVNSIRNGTLKF